MNEGPVAAVSTKLPVPTRDKLAALARRRNVTPSALIRSLVEAFLAGSIDDGEVGDVERAVRSEFEDSEVGPGSRPAMAINLARPMDRDPTLGAANARELRWLLTALKLPPDPEPTCLDETRARHVLRSLGYTITSPATDGGPVSTLGAHESRVTWGACPGFAGAAQGGGDCRCWAEGTGQRPGQARCGYRAFVG